MYVASFYAMLQDYEVLCFEPLHTCLNHIANILTELPLHITNMETLLLFKEVTSLTLKKDKLRAIDYRRALLKLTIKLADLLTENEKEILLLLCEMIGIFYEKEDYRCPRSVLRLYNIAYEHGQAMQQSLSPPKAFTYRKLYGIYYHGAVDHAAFLSRMVCLRSICAELFERYFERIEDITKKTWNKHLEDLVPNAFLHIQGEDAVASNKSAFAIQEREISHLATALPKPTNTTFTRDHIVKKSRLWQAHLFKICDYIKPGQKVWWQWRDDGSIEFFDSPTELDQRPEGPPLYHFRSHSIKDVQQSLSGTWELCKENPQDLPLIKLRDEDGKLVYNRDPLPTPSFDEDEASHTCTNQYNTAEDDTDIGNVETDQTGEIMENVLMITITADKEPIGSTENDELPNDQACQITDEHDVESNTTMDSLANQEHNLSVNEIEIPSQPPTKKLKPKTNNEATSTTNTPFSKTAKAIVTVLGDKPPIRELDRIKSKLQTNPSSKFYKSKYDIYLAQIQTDVLKKLQALKTQLKEWDVNFLSSHNRIARCEDYNNDEDYKNMLTKKKVALKLLQSWNITVHLT